MQNNETNFLDKKTLIAVGIVMLMWLGWQSYMSQKYPPTPVGVQQTPVVATEDTEQANTLSAVTQPNSGEVEPEAVVAQVNSIKEEEFLIQSEKYNILLSSKGMGFKSVELLDYKNRDLQHVVFQSVGLNLFETKVVGQRATLPFAIQKVNDFEWLGIANYEGVKIEKRMLFSPDTYSVKTKIDITGIHEQFPGIENYIADVLEPEQPSSFLMPSFARQEFFVHHETETTREIIDPDRRAKGFKANYQLAQLASIGNQYFAQAIVDKSVVIPSVESFVDANKQMVGSVLAYPVPNRATDLTIEYIQFAGPKVHDLLEKVDPNLVEIIDFGMFSIIATPMLNLMKWFFNVFHNYGIAIILLTLVVRVLVLPFAIVSFKSMKAMQVIQPEMKRLREKYKADPQKMNMEVMALMKKHKANPMAGCLPMLLQFPVFIALYRVLGESIELYQAPFVFWITDLSLKDPFYVLPVLMGITMYFQQKLTPSNLDPAQAKVMAFMPVLFSLMMVALPSGLTLYIFVSTLFGVVQQLVFLKDKTPLANSVVQAKA